MFLGLLPFIKIVRTTLTYSLKRRNVEKIETLQVVAAVGFNFNIGNYGLK